jgi:hypothetical protein
MGPRRNEMSDEQREDTETEVEGHAATADVNDEHIDADDENEFEAHIKFPNVRMD